MSGSSLQDQLLKLGLAKEKPAPRKRRKPARKRSSAKPAGRGSDPGGEISLEQAYARRQREEKQARARSAREKQLEAARRKKLNDEIAAMALPAALNEPDAPEDRFFEYAGKIRKIYVTPAQQAALTEGTLGIVSLRGRFLILPAEVVARVAAIKPDAVALAPAVEEKVE